MIHALGSSSLRARLLRCAALLPAAIAAQATAQSTPVPAPNYTIGNDLLTPLVEQTPTPSPPAKTAPDLTVGNDMLTPLVESAPTPPPAKAAPDLTIGNDLLTPLVESAPTPPAKPAPQVKPAPAPSADAARMNDGLADLLGPLERNPEVSDNKTPAKKPRVIKVRPTDPLEIDVAQYERELAEQEAKRRRRDAEHQKQEKPLRTILVERNYVDPCGSFTVSWGGTKKCQPLQRTRWELVDVDKEKDKDKDKQAPQTPNRDDGRSPSDLGSAPGPSGSPRPAGAPAPGGAPGAAPAPQSGGAPGSAPSRSGGGGGAGSGSVVPGPTALDAEGFATIGEFAVRVDRATRMPNGDIDLLAIFKTRARTRKLIGNGDWRVYVTDEDGVSTDTTALYSPAPGELRPFAQMPYVAADAPAQVRLRVVLAPGMAAIRAVTVVLTGQRFANFPIGPLGSSATPPAQPAATSGSPLKRLEVRIDEVRTVAQTTELSFSARNITNGAQFAHGTYLVFNGSGPGGKVIGNTGRVYAVRGAIGRQYEGISVLPGQTGRFRVVFDAPNVRGPIQVTDGEATAVLTLSAAPEPQW